MIFLKVASQIHTVIGHRSTPQQTNYMKHLNEATHQVRVMVPQIMRLTVFFINLYFEGYSESEDFFEGF